MNILIILFVSLGICLLLNFCVHKIIKYREGSVLDVHHKAQYNGKKMIASPSTTNNFGFVLMGKFRIDTNGSCVQYLFLSLFFPIFPLGCYRIIPGYTKNLGRVGAAHKSIQELKVFGSEKWDFWEVLSIYLFWISIIIGCLIVYNLWDYIF